MACAHLYIESHFGVLRFMPCLQAQAVLNRPNEILKNASLKDDEDFHDPWANLLANATMREGKTHPSFVQVLEGANGS